MFASYSTDTPWISLIKPDELNNNWLTRKSKSALGNNLSLLLLSCDNYTTEFRDIIMSVIALKLSALCKTFIPKHRNTIHFADKKLNKWTKSNTGIYLGLLLDCLRHSWKQFFSSHICMIFSSSEGKLMDSGTGSTMVSGTLHNTNVKQNRSWMSNFTLYVLHIDLFWL